MLDQHLYWLNSLTPDLQREVGDKALYLGMVGQSGYPTVPGFVLSANAFREFLGHVHWSEPLLADFPHSEFHVDIAQPRQLQAIAQHIQHTLTTSQFSAEWSAQLEEISRTFESRYLICRPSIGLAEPYDDSVLETKIKGLLSPQYCRVESLAIAQAIQQVWADVFRAKSLFVWQRLNIPLHALRIAVLVQPLCPAIASGTIQSQGDRLEIKACWGLGRVMKTGEVIPDSYWVNADSGTLEAQTLEPKLYAYGISGEPCLEPWTELSQLDQLTSSLTRSSPPLSRYSVKPDYQNAAVLSEAELFALTHLYQAVSEDQRPLMEAGQAATVEWIVEKSASPSPPSSGAQNWLSKAVSRTESSASQSMEVFITQILPRGKVASPEHQGLAESSNHATLTPSMTPNRRYSTSESTTLATPIVQALGAAPGQVVAPVWIVDDHPQRSIAQLPTGYVLVAADVTPDWVLDMKRAVAVVSERGGMTCHAAILARELGIPAVVGAHQATQLLTSGDKVLMNGDRGTIHRVDSAHPSLSGTESSGLNRKPEEVEKPGPHPHSDTGDRPTLHPAGQRQHTQLMVSVSQPDQLSRLRDAPIDGIGLLRGELLLPAVLNRQSLEDWIQVGQEHELIYHLSDRLRLFVEAVYPRPVYYRTADLRAHEFRALLGTPLLGNNPPGTAPSGTTSSDIEHNPLLGNHGTLSYVHHPDLFQVELAALHQLRRSGYENIHLMLPFVRTVEEFIACRQIMLRANVLDFPDFQVWIMAEVPSVLFLLSEYVKAGVSGIAIGMNDLTQLMLALDRNHPSLSKALDPRHPAVMRAVEHLIKTAQQLSIPCSICGEAPGQYPELVNQFVEWGVTSLVVSPNAVSDTYQAIAQAEQKG